MKIKTFKHLAFTLLTIACISLMPAAVSGQDPAPQPSAEMREDFSDEELKSFLKANEQVMAIQTEAEQKMIKAIEDEGLTLDRFNEILEQQRDPQRGGETSAEELRSFNKAAELILQENARVEKEMTTSIEQQGIDIDTYKQIMVAYQQNAAIQNRVNEMAKAEN